MKVVRNGLSNNSLSQVKTKEKNIFKSKQYTFKNYFFNINVQEMQDTIKILKVLKDHQINVKKVLDLGSGSTLKRFALINEYSLSNYTAVEFQDILSLLTSEITAALVHSNSFSWAKAGDIVALLDEEETIFPLFKYYTNNILHSETKINEETFNSIFTHRQELIKEYLSAPKETKFDLVICSKILSNLQLSEDNQLQNTWAQILNKLSPQGVVFLRTNGPGYQISPVSEKSFPENPQVRRVFTKNQVLELVKKLKTLSPIESNTVDHDKIEYNIICKNTAVPL